MSGYGSQEARIYRERKPRQNYCGSCGEACDSLVCEDCRGECLVTAAPSHSQWEPSDEAERSAR